MLHTTSVPRYLSLVVAMDVTVVVMAVGLIGFVWAYLGTSRRWLAWSSVACFAAALSADLLPGRSVAFAQITALQSLQTYGDASYVVPQVVPSGWNLLTYAGVLLMLAFIVDASLRQWRRGARRRALLIGGSVTLWLVASALPSALIDAGVVEMPYPIGVSFTLVLIAVAYQLTAELAVAARMTDELLEGERRMALASAAASFGVWTWDVQHQRFWATERARSLLGLSPSEPPTLARYIESTFAHEREQVRRALAAALKRGTDFDLEHSIRVAGGNPRRLAHRGQVERDATGRARFMRGVVADVSARFLADQRLRELQEQVTHGSRVSQLGQLASAMAHELGQPLGAIQRNAEAGELFLARDPPELDELRPILADILVDNRRARDVIERLRNLLKRRSIRLQPIDIGSVIDDVMTLTRADAARRGVLIEAAVDSRTAEVAGDEVHLKQVLLNLLLNALDAAQASAHRPQRVLLAAVNDADTVQVSVSDSGDGIEADRVPQVFEPFFTTKSEGMGIGLSISRTIVEAHGGRIWAQSHGECGGASFHFSLPAIGLDDA